MITAYGLKDSHTLAHHVKAGGNLPGHMAWVDATQPTNDELEHIGRMAHVRLPKLQDVRLLEQSRQAYTERGVTYLLIPTVSNNSANQPSSSVMLLVLTPNLLLTIHDHKSRTIENLATTVHKDPSLLAGPENILIGFFEALIARCADLSETISHEMEQVSHIVFQESLQRSKAPGHGQANSWRKVLMGLGRTARLNHKLRNTLAGLERTTDFLCRTDRKVLSESAASRINSLHDDIHSLVRHVDFLISESNFLLDAIVGAISIEQNNVIKLFSVVTVAIMPPTLVGSIYGMNFTHMPELDWLLGYPMALVLMVLSAVLPLWFFKRNGWF